MTTPRAITADLTGGANPDDDDDAKTKQAKTKTAKQPEQTDQEKAQAAWQDELNHPERVLQRHEAQAADRAQADAKAAGKAKTKEPEDALKEQREAGETETKES
jgi:ATP adenylyltransferase/5',5'''-P-1,P-4-tetraphosphate phosphorylase II